MASAPEVQSKLWLPADDEGLRLAQANAPQRAPLYDPNPEDRFRILSAELLQLCKRSYQETREPMQVVSDMRVKCIRMMVVCRQLLIEL